MVDRNKAAREKLRNKTIVIFGSTITQSTGNSKLIYNMSKAFMSKGHKVYTIGLEYNGPQIYYDKIPVLPGFYCQNCGHAHKGDNEYLHKIADYMNLFKPDYFICVGDAVTMQQFGMGNLQFRANTKSIMYLTIDSEGAFCNERELDNGKKEYVLECDRVISTAQFTKDQLKEWLDIDSDVIYEAIDLNTYHPIDKDKRTELRKKYRFKENDFIIFNSGRNIIRKRLFTLLDGVVKFLCETKDTYLLLNCPCEGVYPDSLNPKDFITRVMKKVYGRDMLEEGRIIFLDRSGLGSNKITEKENAEHYQISDVYATASSGEGFSLTPVESMSCGVPAITVDNSTSREILNADVTSENSGFISGSGGLVVEAPHGLYVDHSLRQHLTNGKLIYKAIKSLFGNEEARKQHGMNGRQYVEMMFNFETFKDKWLKVIETTKKKEVKKQEEFKPMDMGKKDEVAKNGI